MKIRLVLLALLAAGACIPDLAADDDAIPVRTPHPGARPGGTITLAIPPLDGIDPGNVHDPSGALVVATMCDTLVSFDPLTGEPKPGIADSWTITRGGRRLFIKLRNDVRFHDGSVLTADDVAFTLSRVASQEYASRAASLLSPIAGYGFVHGDDDTESARARRELIGVRAADRRTVEITLSDPRADFIRVFGHPATAPVPKEAVEADPDGFERAPVCAGPYELAATWEPGAPVRLSRFADYHGRNVAFTSGGAGYADSIVFVERDTREDEARAFRRGRVDVARAPEDVRGERIVRAPGGRVEFVGLPTSVAPFDNPLVRQALSLALDRDRIAERVFGGSRNAARAFLPPGIAPDSRACAQTLPTDVRRARLLLDQAGVELGDVNVPFLFNDDARNRALVVEVARQWRSTLGLRTRAEPMTFQAFIERGRTASGFQGAFRFGWEASYPGPESFLVPLFDDSGIGINNLSRYDSALFADLLDAARREIDDDDRAAAYARLSDALCVEMPMIPVTVDERAFLVRSRIDSAIGRMLDAATGDPIVRELYVR